jgi:hypothetical protein
LHKLSFAGLLLLSIIQFGYTQQDTSKQTRRYYTPSLGGIFLSAGIGLSVPLGEFNNNSSSSFGLLGRLEYSSISIFPLVLGGEITYFSYGGADEFKTQNLLTTFDTKLLSVGLTAEYALSNFFNITYTTPFLTADVKYTIIKRDIEPSSVQFENLPANDKKISVGFGAGFTLFIFDFSVKYIYMKDLTSVGVFTKIKFPAIRF